MNERRWLIDRRSFLRSTAGIVGGASLFPLEAKAAGEPLKVAAVVTEFTYRSHAHVILENFLEPYLFNGKPVEPNMKVVGLYVDQFPERDMGREVARQYGIPIFPDIAGALR